MLFDVLTPLRFLCQSDPATPGYGMGYGMGYGPNGWSHMMWPGGSVFMMLLIVVVFFLVIRMVRRSSCSPESPLDILKRRYAQGEITRENFEQMKRDIKD